MKTRSLHYVSLTDLPLVYHMEYAKGIFKIIVHPKVYAWCIRTLGTHPHVLGSSAKNKLQGLREFIFPSQLQIPGLLPDFRWGFDKCISHEKDYEKDWDVLKARIPEVTNIEKGTIDYTDIKQLQVTLSAFFLLLSAYELDDMPISGSQSQLMHIPLLSTDGGLWGGSLSAYLSPALCNWLREAARETDITIPAVEEAMRSAYTHMEPDTDDPYPISCLVKKPGALILQVPGDACDLSFEDWSEVQGNYGYKLVPHNTDQPLQQFTLLVGLVKLYELARKDIYGI